MPHMFRIGDTVRVAGNGSQPEMHPFTGTVRRLHGPGYHPEWIQVDGRSGGAPDDYWYVDPQLCRLIKRGDGARIIERYGPYVPIPKALP